MEQQITLRTRPALTWVCGVLIVFIEKRRKSDVLLRMLRAGLRQGLTLAYLGK